jgi:SAM-dependent methyltransferase
MNGPTPDARRASNAHADLTRRIREYWNARIHDLEMTEHEVGTLAFFDDLDEYRFDKLRYLPRLVDFSGFTGRTVLEVGCGIGTDLVRFARGGARAIGVDFSEIAITLANRNLILHDVSGAGHVLLADGEQLPFADGSVDVVYAHGVLQYAADPPQLISETRRVLRRGGEAIFMVYNRRSWLMALSVVMHVPLEHEDAPGLRFYTIGEFRRLLAGFSQVRIQPERFPVRSRLHHGWKAAVYNGLFVGAFNALPRRLVRPLGWHLMASCHM